MFSGWKLIKPLSYQGGWLPRPWRFVSSRTKTQKKVIPGIKDITFTSFAVILMKKKTVVSPKMGVGWAVKVQG